MAIVLAHVVLLSCVFGSEGQKTPKELAVVAYSARVPVGDEFSERVFGLWLRELKDKNPVTVAGDYLNLWTRNILWPRRRSSYLMSLNLGQMPRKL